MSTTATEITTQSPDVSILKTEIFDVDYARQLVDDKNIPKEERDKLKRYLKNRVRGNQHDTTYKLGKNMKHEFLGRFCALRGESLQDMSRDIRSALALPYYWDLDIVNAQPTLLYQYAERNGWKSDTVKKYIEQREEMLNEICETLNVERWEAKDRVIHLFFGNTNYDGLPSFFVEELQPELRLIMKNNWELNKSKLKFLEKQPNHYGKGLADILQTEERNCLMALDRALSKHGRSLDVLIHDGGLVRKKDNEVHFPKSLITQLEKEIETETGYKVSLAIKPMKTSFTKLNNEDDYAEKKLMFEETGWKGAIHFKLRNPAAFIMIQGDHISQISRTDLLQNEEDNKLNDGNLFIKRWLEDSDKKEYNKIVFNPKNNHTESEFNLYRGLPTQPKEGDYSIYQELLELLVNHDKASFHFVEKWLAHIVQKPYKKTGVVLIFRGEKGIGKDTFWNAFGRHILGPYFLSTGKAEHDVFGRFSSLAKKFLVKIEEANFSVNKENDERFKSLITSETDNLEQKGKDPIPIDSYANFVLTTNQTTAVNLDQGERRFAIFEASDERKRDYDFWKRVYATFENKSVHEAYLDYLLKLDISDFYPEQEAYETRTNAYKESLQLLSPYHSQWFQFVTEGKEDNDVLQWKGRDLCNLIRGSHYVKFDLTEKRLGVDLKNYIQSGILTKEHTRMGNHYQVEVGKLRAYLKERGWWNDFLE